MKISGLGQMCGKTHRQTYSKIVASNKKKSPLGEHVKKYCFLTNRTEGKLFQTFEPDSVWANLNPTNFILEILQESFGCMDGGIKTITWQIAMI